MIIGCLNAAHKLVCHWSFSCDSMPQRVSSPKLCVHLHNLIVFISKRFNEDNIIKNKWGKLCQACQTRALENPEKHWRLASYSTRQLISEAVIDISHFGVKRENTPLYGMRVALRDLGLTFWQNLVCSCILQTCWTEWAHDECTGSTASALKSRQVTEF